MSWLDKYKTEKFPDGGKVKSTPKIPMYDKSKPLVIKEQLPNSRDMSPAQYAMALKLKQQQDYLASEEAKKKAKDYQNKRILEEANARQANSKITTLKDKSLWDKTKNAARNPLATATGTDKGNAFDDFLFGTPAMMVSGAYNTIGNAFTPSTYTTLGKGLVNAAPALSNVIFETDYNPIFNDGSSEKSLEFGMDALMGLPVLAGTSKYAKPVLNNLGNKYLPNVHKLNPWAFKPNPEMGYRMLGREGFEDALETGVLRAKPVPNQPPTGGISLVRNTNRNPNTGKMQKALDRPYFADGYVDERYAADYMAAVNKSENNLIPIPTHKGIAPPQAGSIPLEKAIMYQKDWLQGYKQIEVPKSNFKSAIDNNGTFDMTNPNIYKTILPIGLGLRTASPIKEYKNGGVVSNWTDKYK